MTFLGPDAIARAVAGEWLVPPPPDRAAAPLRGVATDTREEVSARAFIALRGARFDAHDHLPAAIDGGADVLVVDRPPTASVEERARAARVGVLRVEDTGEALIALARAWRATLSPRAVIAITGSCGKTTTKALLAAILERVGPTVASPKSFNNAIGVPLTILAAPRGTAFLVVEIGMNAPGEIAPLARLARPTTAIVTTVARGHLAGFDDSASGRVGADVADEEAALRAIAREKCSIAAGLDEEGDLLVPAGHDVIEAELARSAPRARVLRVGVSAPLAWPAASSRDATDSAPPDAMQPDRSAELPVLRARVIDRNGGQSLVVDGPGTLGARSIPLGLSGSHAAHDAMFAIAVASRLGVEDEVIGRALESARPPAMRFDVKPLGRVTLVDDAYNANPDSLAAGIEAFGEVGGGAARRILLLGDMLELGAAESRLHAEALGAIRLDAARWDAEDGGETRVLLVGPRWATARAAIGAATSALACESISVVDDADESALLRAVEEALAGGSGRVAVYAKGSRGIRLERFIARLHDRVPA